jgi:hypothetical protein
VLIDPHGAGKDPAGVIHLVLKYGAAADDGLRRQHISFSASRTAVNVKSMSLSV